MTKVAKWGNSIAVRIPEAAARSARMRAGTSVEVLVEDQSLVVRHVQKRKPTLAELVARITPENQHGYQWGGIEPVGEELW